MPSLTIQMGPVYPPDRASLTYVATPTLARPAYLTKIAEPTWGTELIRVADETAFSETQPTLRHAYSKLQAWNCDGTYFLIGFYYPGHLLNGITFAHIRGIAQPGNPVWSNINPDLLYGVNGGTNEFVVRRISTDVLTTLHTFTAYTNVKVGDGEGNLSLDDHYVALLATRTGTRWLIVYDISGDAIVSETDLGAISPDNCSISPSGQYVIVEWAAGGGSGGQSGIEVYNRSMVFQRRLTTATSHYDLGYTIDGVEICVVAGSLLPSYRLDTGALTNLYPAGNTVIPAESHVSMRATLRPGWCYISYYNQQVVDEGSDQVWAIKTDGSGTIEVFAHAHHNTLGSSSYDAQPQATPSPNGTKVAFASEWDESPIVNIYSYVAGMHVLT